MVEAKEGNSRARSEIIDEAGRHAMGGRIRAIHRAHHCWALDWTTYALDPRSCVWRVATAAAAGKDELIHIGWPRLVEASRRQVCGWQRRPSAASGAMRPAPARVNVSRPFSALRMHV